MVCGMIKALAKTIGNNNRIVTREGRLITHKLTMRAHQLCVALSIGLLYTSHAHPLPNKDSKKIPNKNEWFLGIAAGYGQRSNPLIESSPIDLYFIVDVAWYRDKWFFDNGDIGYSIIDNERYTVNLAARINSERLFFQKANTNLVSIGDLNAVSPGEFDDPVPASNPVPTDAVENPNVPPDSAPEPEPEPTSSPKSPSMGDGNETPAEVEIPSRRFALESGVEFITDGDWGYFQASIFGDVSQIHRGYELSVNYGKRFHVGRWIYDASIGAAWKSSKLNHYYYGISPSETSDALPVYNATAGLNRFGRFLIRYPINKHWQIAFLSDIEYLSAEIHQSPLVKDSKVNSSYLGVKYLF